MRIDNPTVHTTGSGHFSGSFEGDGGQLTNVAPLAGTGVTVVGTTVSIGQAVATTSDVTFDDVTATTITADTGTFVYQYFESSSTIITSGSNVFGNDASDIQQITGSLKQSGSAEVVGLLAVTGTGTSQFSSHLQSHCLGVGTTPSGVSGEIRATADITAFYSSDERLKENIKPIENSLGKISQISGNTFDWIKNDEVHSHEGSDIGVIAQEIEAVLPELVTNRENGYKAVQYDKLTAVLIEAVKELSERVKALEGK